MPGVEFFIVVMILGVVLLVFSGIVGLRMRHMDVMQNFELRVVLELSLCAVFFALLPFPLYFLTNYAPFTWRAGSFLLAVCLFVQIARLYYKVNLYGVRWPFAAISLLVLSGILLTIEVVNSFWWAALSVYAWGLLWILTLSGIQFIAFVLYDRQPATHMPFVQSLDADSSRPKYGYPGALQQRLQRDNTAGHPNTAANGYRHTYRDPVSYARRQRHAHRLTNSQRRRGWRNADPTVGANEYTQRR